MENIAVLGCNPFDVYHSLVVLVTLIIISSLDTFFCEKSKSNERMIKDVKAPTRRYHNQTSFVYYQNQLLYFHKKVGWKVVNPKVRKQLKF